MINRILTICAATALGLAGTSLARAQQGYPAPQGPSYSVAPQPYSQGNMPDFDAINDDDDAPRNSAALPPPGPVMSPDDPRYGRPMNAPVYSDRGAPTGPVMSPDDPRYGRPMGPPPVIYGDRGGPQQANRDNGVPAAGVSYGDDRGGMRPPEGVTGAVPQQQAPVDANGKPLQIAAQIGRAHV